MDYSCRMDERRLLVRRSARAGDLQSFPSFPTIRSVLPRSLPSLVLVVLSDYLPAACAVVTAPGCIINMASGDAWMRAMVPENQSRIADITETNVVTAHAWVFTVDGVTTP